MRFRTTIRDGEASEVVLMLVLGTVILLTELFLARTGDPLNELKRHSLKFGSRTFSMLLSHNQPSPKEQSATRLS